MKPLTILVLALTCSGSHAWAGTCTVPRYEFVFGSDSAASMVVKSGTSCTSTINRRSSIDSSSISQSPAHGTAATADPHHWSYQARPGFTGNDAFAVALSGTSYRKGASGSIPISGTTHINVSVQVVP